MSLLLDAILACAIFVAAVVAMVVWGMIGRKRRVRRRWARGGPMSEAAARKKSWGY